jgi:hypothetical protein
MKISLRKANALQHAIIETIRNIKITLDVQLNEFQDVNSVLSEVNQTLLKNDDRRQKLLLSLYTIRGLVGQANSSSGIDLALSKSAYFDKRIAQVTELSNVKPVTELAVLIGQIDKIRNRPVESDRFGSRYSDTVTTNVLTKDQIDNANTEIQILKKEKQKLADEVLELNIKTEIPLSDTVVETLTAEGLI